jgi:hypothetical protein
VVRCKLGARLARKIPFAYKRASTPCPACGVATPSLPSLHGLWTEPAGKCGFIRHRAVPAAKPLDSFPASAQNHSYTNKITGCVPSGQISAQPNLWQLRRLAFRTSSAREFVDVD